MEIVEINRKMYQAAKGSVKRAISTAQEANRKTFSEKVDGQDMKGNVLRVAIQMVRQTEML